MAPSSPTRSAPFAREKIYSLLKRGLEIRRSLACLSLFLELPVKSISSIYFINFSCPVCGPSSRSQRQPNLAAGWPAARRSSSQPAGDLEMAGLASSARLQVDKVKLAPLERLALLSTRRDLAKCSRLNKKRTHQSGRPSRSSIYLADSLQRLTLPAGLPSPSWSVLI